MKILVGCKLVAEEQDIIVSKEGTLDVSKAAPKISQFDLNAMQVAIDIKNNNEDIFVSALSVGGKYLENPKAKKDILSRGADELIALVDEKFENLLPDQTSKIMASKIKNIDFDLIICGDGSGDLYAQQTGIRLGELLNVNTINGVSKIESVFPDKIIVERALENEIEIIEIPLPAVISVSADINEPAIPGMKAILKASKKPVNVTNSDDIEFNNNLKEVELINVKAPKQKDRLNIIVEGDDDNKIIEFINNIKKVIN